MYRTTILRFKFAFTFLLFDLFSSNYECTSYCTKILFDPISSICTLLCIARYCIWGFRNFDSSLCTFYTTLLPDEQLVQNIAFLDRPKNFRLQSFHVEVRLMRKLAIFDPDQTVISRTSGVCTPRLRVLVFWPPSSTLCRTEWPLLILLRHSWCAKILLILLKTFWVFLNFLNPS